MALVEKSVLIEHSAEQMFDLVDHIEAYPQFLPWCSKAVLLCRDDTKTVATLHIAYLGVKSSFTTENAKTRPLSMNIKLLEGPFRRLEGFWHFKPLHENACKVEFRLSYEFSSKVFEKVIGPVFNQIARTFIESFVRRAASIRTPEQQPTQP
ncbi:MAG: type II toxin-antitoxin system RatA family toxin [Pseudomonadota bacterium]